MESITGSLAPQIVYLDFDGENTIYHNEDLNISLDVNVEDSLMSDAQKFYILSQLDKMYDDSEVVFTLSRPDNEEYSTIYIGKTDAFNKYGSFAGLAETIDKGNKIKDDNAFVFADYTSDLDHVISVIDHEIGHIVEGMEHNITVGGLEDYAADSVGVKFGLGSDDGAKLKTYNVNVKKNTKVTVTVSNISCAENKYVTVGGSYVGEKFANATLYIYLDGDLIASKSSGSYSITLNEGSYQFLFKTPQTDLYSRYKSEVGTVYRYGAILMNFSFHIGSPVVLDNAPPVISSTSDTCSYETAVITIKATDAKSKVTQYYVNYWYYDANGKKIAKDQKSTKNQITLANLMPGIVYYYQVAAEDEYNNKSNYSVTKEFTTLTDTEAPVFTSDIAYASTGNNITLSWNAATDNASVSHYEINFNGAVYTTKNRSLLLNNVTPGVYSCSVTALDKTGNSSTAQTITTQAYTITDSISGSGSLTGAGTYFSGTPITVTATPDTHQLLVSLAVNGQNVDGGTATITVNKDTQVSAAFRPMEQYTVSVAGNYAVLNSLLTITGTDKNAENGKFYETSSVTFAAGYKQGYAFENWTINGTEYATDNVTINNLSSNLTATANYYKLGQYIVNLTSNITGLESIAVVTGTDTTTVSGANIYYERSSVTITAQEQSGYVFDHWDINGKVYHTSSVTLTDLSANLEAVAYYDSVYASAETQKELVYNFGNMVISTSGTTPTITVNGNIVANGTFIDGIASFDFNYIELGAELNVTITGSSPLSLNSSTDMVISTDLDISGIETGRCGGGIGGRGGTGGKGGIGGKGGVSYGGAGGAGGTSSGIYSSGKNGKAGSVWHYHSQTVRRRGRRLSGVYLRCRRALQALWHYRCRSVRPYLPVCRPHSGIRH